MKKKEEVEPFISIDMGTEKTLGRRASTECVFVQDEEKLCRCAQPRLLRCSRREKLRKTKADKKSMCCEKEGERITRRNFLH